MIGRVSDGLAERLQPCHRIFCHVAQLLRELGMNHAVLLAFLVLEVGEGFGGFFCLEEFAPRLSGLAVTNVVFQVRLVWVMVFLWFYFSHGFMVSWSTVSRPLKHR